VIATVILVSVTIVVAVAVSYWMGGIAGIYTRFEKIEISSCYAVKDTANGQYNITVTLKNSGSQDATVTDIMLNGKPLSQYAVAQINSTLPTTGQSIAIGQSGTLYIYIRTSVYEAGTTLDLKFRTAAGKEYPQMLTLP